MLLSVSSSECSAIVPKGALLTQFILPPISEYDMFHSLLLLQCFGAWSLQAIGIGTAGMFFLSACPLFVGLLLNRFLLPIDREQSPGSRKRDISLWTYAIGQANSLFGGTLLIIGVLEFFVPLVSLFPSCWTL
jgi:hypothetical protein